MKPLKHSGFSLIELIVVIVMLSIISVGFSSFYAQSVQQYVDADARADMSASARFVLERMAYEVRDALPNSLRVSSDGNCIEFRYIESGGYYLDIPLVAASNSVNVADFVLPPTGTWHLAVMPLTSGEVYGASAASIARINSIGVSVVGVTNIQLQSNHTYMRGSPTNRFFIVGEPISFCISNRQLFRYNGYTQSATQPLPGAGLSGGVLYAQNLDAGNAGDPVFQYTAGTLQRNALLTMSLRYQQGDESLRYEHDVLIRNIP